ncbi:MAG TPA: IclR family transcriptional regulator [Desulfobacterales bacterium]|nr:IclR family transcriptional regulator [Desulfobacterales bacterium]
MDSLKQTGSPAVERAIDVIELMASEKEVQFSDILRRLSIPRQSLVRILNTLCHRGIVEKTKKRGTYRLGIRLLYLGNSIQTKINLRSVARPFMEELAELVRKNIELATLDQDQLVLIEQVEGTEEVRLYARVGSAYPYLHAVAAGKIYLAHMDQDKRKEVLRKIGLPPVTEHTITDFRKLEKDLHTIRKRGFAFEDQELRKGIRRVAAPIYDFRNALVGSLCIAATVLSFELEDVDHFGALAKETAMKISAVLGKDQKYVNGSRYET